MLLLLIPKNLLLQHDSVHARLQQCENRCCLSLQPTQSVQDFRRRLSGQVGQDARHLWIESQVDTSAFLR